MAKKKIAKQFKIMAPGGKATPAPPLGPALGANGINPGQFIQQFNERTKELNGKVVGCIITVFADRTFEFEIKSSPAAVMIKDLSKAEKGSATRPRLRVCSGGSSNANMSESNAARRPATVAAKWV